MRKMRFRKNDSTHNVLAAVANWIKERGGDVLVIGGIELQDWHEHAGKFRVAVRCLGKPPAKKVKP